MQRVGLWLKGVGWCAMVMWMAMADVAPVAAAGDGDNYPWKGDTRFPECAADSWSFCKRYCTSWAAFALSDRNGYQMEHIGHAKDWKTKAQALGYVVDRRPAPGAIAWWDSNDDSRYGHVAWVKAVNGDAVTIEEYNYDFGGTHRERVIRSNDAGAYIHYKDLPGNEVFSVIKKNQRDGTNVVYWAKADGVFETWWRPDGSGTYHSQLVHISQGDVKAIDAEIAGDDLHQVYTATTHNIYETWWYPHQGVHTSDPPIIHSAQAIRKIIKSTAADGTHQLYVMTDAGVDEYWWRQGSAIQRTRLFTLANPVAMQKRVEPDGSHTLYVADQSYAYAVRWRAGAEGIAVQEISHIVQNDIVDIDVSIDSDGTVRRLYVGTRGGGVWESSWAPDRPDAVGHRQVTGGTGIRAIQKHMDGADHALYVATAGGVYEYTWSSLSAMHGGAIVQGLGDVRAFHRASSVDGSQALYTAYGTHIAETYWTKSGQSPKTSVIE